MVDSIEDYAICGLHPASCTAAISGDLCDLTHWSITNEVSES